MGLLVGSRKKVSNRFFTYVTNGKNKEKTYQSQITHSQLPILHYQLPIPHYLINREWH
ncbi:MAG: hypothetical protein ACRCT1_14375 [Microcoleaceae cyanobacterium]